MLPVLKFNNVIDSCGRDSVFLCQFRSGNPCCYRFFANIYNVLLSKFSVPVSSSASYSFRVSPSIVVVADRNSSFFASVIPIISRRSQKQMMWINTLRIVAFVANVFIGRVNSIMKKICDSMCASVLAQIRENAVAGIKISACPLPAFSRRASFKFCMKTSENVRRKTGQILRRKFWKVTIIVGHSLASLSCDLGLIRRWRVVSSRFLF